ncbi:hypothetical protein [Vibrio harveyi]|uniref:hypothetical protein n=1 Tax=Vibrio harveyi TaxID=669 RepID=UPI0030F5737C
MNSNTNDSSIAALVNAANQKKNIEKGREALAVTQAINNKSSVQSTNKKNDVNGDKGKRRNVYFNAKSLNNLARIEKADDVGMSPAVQAALHLFANTSDKKREAVYRELKIQCAFDD